MLETFAITKQREKVEATGELARKVASSFSGISDLFIGVEQVNGQVIIRQEFETARLGDWFSASRDPVMTEEKRDGWFIAMKAEVNVCLIKTLSVKIFGE